MAGPEKSQTPHKPTLAAELYIELKKLVIKKEQIELMDGLIKFTLQTLLNAKTLTSIGLQPLTTALSDFSQLKQKTQALKTKFESLKS